MRTAGEILARALGRRGPCRILAARERPWASATFVGARHHFRMAVESAAFLRGIEEADFDLGDHLLADIAVIERSRGADGLIVAIEALTIEDWRDDAETPARAAIGPRRRWAEGKAWTTCGTKGAFVPLAAA